MFDFFPEPSAPVNLSITHITDTHITLEWSPPAEPNGVLQQYIVGYRRSAEQQEKHAIVEASETNCVVTDLKGHQNYTLRVQACTSYRPCGLFSRSVVVETLVGGEMDELKNKKLDRYLITSFLIQ